MLDNLRINDFEPAKTPWSWGRIQDILSEKMRGEKDRHEAFGARVAARNKTSLSLRLH